MLHFSSQTLHNVARVLFALFLSLFLMQGAQAAISIKEGVDYRLLPQAQPTTKDKIEVIEFFSYTCIHCYHLEKALHPWEKTLAKDVAFSREQIIWQSNMQPLATLFQTLKSAQLLDKLHLKVFAAFLDERRDLRQDATLQGFLKQNKIDAHMYAQHAKSFSVNNAVLRAQKMTKDYQVDSTPMIVVGGRYVTIAHEPKRLLQIVDALIEKVRQEKQ